MGIKIVKYLDPITDRIINAQLLVCDIDSGKGLIFLQKEEKNGCACISVCRFVETEDCCYYVNIDDDLYFNLSDSDEKFIKKCFGIKKIKAVATDPRHEKIMKEAIKAGIDPAEFDKLYERMI